jgi:hypothetical protein
MKKITYFILLVSVFSIDLYGGTLEDAVKECVNKALPYITGKNIAILLRDEDNIKEEVFKDLCYRFQQNIKVYTKSNNIQILPRDAKTVQRILQEANLAGLVSDDEAVALGKQLGVKCIVVLDLYPHSPETYKVVAEVIDITLGRSETIEIISSIQDKYLSYMIGRRGKK